LAHTFQNNTLCLLMAPGLKQFRLASRQALRPMLIFSICMLFFALILFAGSHNIAEASTSASKGNLHDTAFLAGNQISLNLPILPPVSILSPENTTYTVSEISLTFKVSGPISWAGYSLDGQANTTILGNTTLTNLAQGLHSVVIYINDTAGEVASSQTVYFTVGQVNILEMVPLGIIQGLTEWLPVSSTAHLKIAQHLMNFQATALLDVTLHIGTLIVVVFYFRKDVKDILSALVHLDFKSEYGRLIPLIIIATIPTGIIGVLYAEFLENTFQTLLIIGITFLIGATYLYNSRIGKENIDTITLTIAFIMGTAQGLASFPGLSRSGVTISTALLLGLKREKAFKFSFLLSIPAIIGDLAFEAYHNRGQFAIQNVGPIELLVGIVLAAVAGYFAIRLVSNLVRSKRFHYFAFYTWILGITLIALTLSGLLTI
jgi:undecaprenyl-diphosphatase